MMSTKTTNGFLRGSIATLILLAVVLVGGATACGGGARRAPVSPSNMPANGNYTGIWNSPQYGEMHFVQTGNALVGEYTKDERRGQIEGFVTGNMMRFTWTERRELVRGHANVTSGHGYFIYSIDENDDHHIDGEWGHDRDEVGGGPWTAIRDRRNRRPQLSTDRNTPSGDGMDSLDGENAPAPAPQPSQGDEL